MAAWVLEYLGRDDVHIMELRYEAWKEQGRGVLYRPVATESKAFTSRIDSSIRAEIADVAGISGEILLDTRSPEEFRGDAEMDDRPGHIPGAVHLPWSDLAGADGNLMIERARLDRRMAEAGITRDDQVVAYCRSGVRASLAYLAMKQAGYNVRLYDGSYVEWMESGHPVEV
jgi:thiosulfate/3-mercaptopyruvate sulfurtransferase